MSLYRQLLLAIVASVALAFGGSFAATMFAARGYLEEQLAIKNADNAAALALSMSQLEKDRATIDLQVVSLFETGQYENIRVRDTKGAVIVERLARNDDTVAPRWFVGLLPIASKPGTGQIGDGFRQFGTVELKSVASFAYRDLYRGAKDMLIGFVAAAIAIGVLGAGILARIRRPLKRIVEQAQAIAERRYLTVPPPDVPELHAVGAAMNQMVERVQAMFAEEAARLEAMRMAANLDDLTRLPNRNYFMNQLRGILDADAGTGAGVLVLFRLRDLAEVNHTAGRAATDALIRSAADVADTNAEISPLGVAGRLNGADFAILLPEVDDPEPVAQAVAAGLNALPQPWRTQARTLAATATTTYALGEEVATLMARLDTALARAEAGEGKGCISVPRPAAAERPLGAQEWREKLLHALNCGWMRLDAFETRALDGSLSHRECFVRLRLNEEDAWMPAGKFLPQVARLHLTADFDLAVAQEMAKFGSATEPLALNLSPDSLGVAGFGERLASIVAATPGLAQRLWIDAPEKGIFQFPDGFRDLLQRMKAQGCRVGADHFGREFDQIGKLYGIGLDYIKIDASFILGVAASPGNRNFLKGVCGICHNMGLAVYALGVATDEDLALLPELGFDGATGPAVKG